MEKILTIVVPTYNAEKYLKDNLESLCITEVMQDIQVLIINDGSIDGSLDIAEKYTMKYPETFHVISKENGGHGSGINCGIQAANGKYFKVVDADDWVEKQAFINLVQFLKSTDSDIVYSGFYWVFDRGQGNPAEFERKVEMKEPFSGVIYKKEYQFDEIADVAYIKMHNMAVKTEILFKNRIVIDEHCYYVDTEYISYPIPYVKTVSFLPDFVYYYRIGSQGQSVGISKMQQYEANYDKVLESLFVFYKQLGAEIPCTAEKRHYIARLIARVVAGKVKIMLSFPKTKEKKEQMIKFDNLIKMDYPEIYNNNINKAIRILRMTNFAAYVPMNILVKRKYG